MCGERVPGVQAVQSLESWLCTMVALQVKSRMRFQESGKNVVQSERSKSESQVVGAIPLYTSPG